MGPILLPRSLRLCLVIFGLLGVVLWLVFGTFYLPSLNVSHNIHSEQSTLLYAVDDTYQKYDLTKIDAQVLTTRVEELLKIRSSVLLDLRQLERNRTLLIQELSYRNSQLEKLKTLITKKSTDLERIQLHIKQAEVAHEEAKALVGSLIDPPLSLLPNTAQNNHSFDRTHLPSFKNVTEFSCQMHRCFDYSRCSLFSPFLVYIYDVKSDGYDGNQESIDRMIIQHFKDNIHVTTDAKLACAYMVLILTNFPYLNQSEKFQDYLFSLPHWGGDGRNHLIVNINSVNLNSLNVNVMKAILMQNHFDLDNYRPGFDLVLPSIQYLEKLPHKDDIAYFSPAKRKYFLSFLGRINENSTATSTVHSLIKRSLLNLLSKPSTSTHNEFLFDFDCDEKTKRLCDNQTIILLESTFTLVLPPVYSNVVSDKELSGRLMNALSSGAIPVVLGGDYLKLPFEEILDWSKAVIRVPVARVTELYVMLKTFPDADIIEMKRFGSHFYRTYFANLKQLSSALFAAIGTHRLLIPPPSFHSINSTYYYNQPKYDLVLTNQSEHFNSIFTNTFHLNDDEENLGPVEPPFPSPTYRRNFSRTLTQRYSMWNEIYESPLYSFSSLPSDPLLPSESKFRGSSFGFRAIGGGSGGSGKEFAEALGGNTIREQFTIVILTYEREKVLLDLLPRFKNLPNLNKVLIVWNSPKPPSPDIVWPDIGVDVVVVKTKTNSLNNRFLPFDEIKTDAILSIDDDTTLRQDEIIFAFRVWREARDRIVGFPARYHSWDSSLSSWYYSSSHTCEFSMILTGAAFFHKYYSYLYTYLMPISIRDKVDEYMNCEDIAMNFLVSHVTRKPPIKVTSRWTFRCPACESSLSEYQSHYQKRNKCINYFEKVYGYTPLLYTQYRADSVLFKTRVPHDKQKCFKFI